MMKYDLFIYYLLKNYALKLGKNCKLSVCLTSIYKETTKIS